MTDQRTTPHPPFVLIANDQEWSARSLESILGPEGYAVLRAYTGRQALDRARSARPDLIILDAQLPDISAIDVCRGLREDPRFNKTVPIIITTAGPSGRSQRLEAYRAGAWEFLGQPLDGEAFLLKVRTFLQCKAAVDDLVDKSLLDEVTGLYNMRGLARRAREIGSEAQRNRHSLACVVFSTAVEDEIPEEGDSEELPLDLTVALAHRLRAVGRTSDVLGRLGPTEFAFLCPATDDRGIVRLVERVTDAVETTAIELPGRSEPVRLIAGYCAVPDFAEASLDPIELVLRATTALRRFHREGLGSRERVLAFDAIPLN